MLANKVFRSSAIFASARLVGRGLDILAALVIARFLTPADFGMVMIALATLMVLEAATELPIVDALIREKEVRPGDVDTGFTLSFLRGTIIAGAMLALSVPISIIYDDQRLILLIALLGLAPFITGLRSPMMVMFAREVNYAPTATIDLIARMTSFATAVVIAWQTGSYFSLLIVSIMPPMVITALTYIWAPYRPRFSLLNWSRLLTFAGWMSISRALATVSQEGDRFLIGGVLGKAPLGFFSMGRSVATTASWAIGMPLVSVMYPSLVKIRENTERLQQSYLRGQSMVAAAIMPISVFLMLMAEPLVRLGLGEKWLAVVPVIQILAPASALATLAMPTQALLLALEKPHQLAKREMLAALIAIPAVVIGAITFGLMGAVIGRALANIFHTALSVEIIVRVAGISWRRQFLFVWRSIAANGAMALFLYESLSWFNDASVASEILSIALAGAGGLAVYGVTHLALWLLSGRPSGAEEYIVSRLLAQMAPKLARSSN
ncbi:lipopolysaccharide biosynthesis protein [Croceicoccus gelatinilyticus]|uniref:lipopolysaccharide biosynthesis protein n=1 Tax=Croceicoccus gelatinilyticus TaxID=2835536 RepID=UPI001BCEC6B2|nr:lipopolysaccharide biosynthesis protein [Croceicoccus gelatinilyticus]MBS7670677.1 lipopolysaccharide biosynthesis protein [Croceicoccus gelatinilyticus]